MLQIMKLMINSEPKQFSGKLISELIQSLDLTTTNGIALAVNDKVVTMAKWKNFELHNDDKITIIKATQGG
jgi:sulfur carrier protein